MCQEDSQCLAITPLWEGCHTEWEANRQVIGRCVPDKYQKGMQVASIILGSVAVVGVVIAIAVAVALGVKK